VNKKSVTPTYLGTGFNRFCIESVGTGNTGVFILKAKTKEEKM
jgi:hypothetical protein